MVIMYQKYVIRLIQQNT